MGILNICTGKPIKLKFIKEMAYNSNLKSFNEWKKLF